MEASLRAMEGGQDLYDDYQQETADAGELSRRGLEVFLTPPPLVSTPKGQPPFTPLSPEMEDFLRVRRSGPRVAAPESLRDFVISGGIEGLDDIDDRQQEMADRTDGDLTFAAKGLQIIPVVPGQVPTEREAKFAGMDGTIPQRFVTPAEGDFSASLAVPPAPTVIVVEAVLTVTFVPPGKEVR